MLPVTLQPGQVLPRTGWKLKTPEELFEHMGDRGIRQWLVESLEGGSQTLEADESFLESGEATGSLQILPTISLNELDVLRWKMAWGSPRFELEKGQARSLHHHHHHRDIYDNVIVPQCRDWNGFDQIQSPSTMIGLSFGAFIYGGLHALAWYAIFDSDSQRFLWRLSSCVVMGGFPLIFVSLSIKNGLQKRFSRHKKMALFVPAPAIALYALARAYLVIECFINLFNLPAGVYNVPNWTAYFPHIS